LFARSPLVPYEGIGSWQNPNNGVVDTLLTIYGLLPDMSQFFLTEDGINTLTGIKKVLKGAV